MPSPFVSHSFTTRELMFSACLHLFDCVRHCMHQFVLSPHGPYFVSHLMAFCFYIKLAAGDGVRWWVLRFFWVWYCSTYRLRGGLTMTICCRRGYTDVCCRACLADTKDMSRQWFLFGMFTCMAEGGTEVPPKRMYVIAMPGASRSGVFIETCHNVVS